MRVTRKYNKVHSGLNENQALVSSLYMAGHRPKEIVDKTHLEMHQVRSAMAAMKRKAEAAGTTIPEHKVILDSSNEAKTNFRKTLTGHESTLFNLWHNLGNSVQECAALLNKKPEVISKTLRKLERQAKKIGVDIQYKSSLDDAVKVESTTKPLPLGRRSETKPPSPVTAKANAKALKPQSEKNTERATPAPEQRSSQENTKKVEANPSPHALPNGLEEPPVNLTKRNNKRRIPDYYPPQLKPLLIQVYGRAKAPEKMIIWNGVVLRKSSEKIAKVLKISVEDVNHSIERSSALLKVRPPNTPKSSTAKSSGENRNRKNSKNPMEAGAEGLMEAAESFPAGSKEQEDLFELAVILAKQKSTSPKMKHEVRLQKELKPEILTSIQKKVEDLASKSKVDKSGVEHTIVGDSTIGKIDLQPGHYITYLHKTAALTIDGRNIQREKNFALPVDVPLRLVATAAPDKTTKTFFTTFKVEQKRATRSVVGKNETGGLSTDVKLGSGNNRTLVLHILNPM